MQKPLDTARSRELFWHSLRSRLNDEDLASTKVYRCFNGFLEGLPGLVVDRYQDTLVISNHHKNPSVLDDAVNAYGKFALEELAEIESILIKTRHSTDLEERKGVLVYGTTLPEHVVEHGIRYALDLRLNQDNSFYPDTRSLRLWLRENSPGRSVLNCFAYTGSLGIAALAGGTHALVQTDLNGTALRLAQRSYDLNRFANNMTLLERDFFSAVNQYKKTGTLFDLVILDAPYFSDTRYGKVDLQKNFLNLVNKLRPLAAHGGKLVLINNALYVSGQELMDQIDNLQESGYLRLQQIIPIPDDITGYPRATLPQLPCDPAPFNHSTKIVVLDVRRKDERKANFGLEQLK